jgi:hypothetical protein
VSEGKKDGDRKVEESRLAKVKGIRFVQSGSSGVEIMTVGPHQAEALRRQHEKKQAEGESTGDETGGAGAGEETATNE